MKVCGLMFWVGILKYCYFFYDCIGDFIFYFVKKGWYICMLQVVGEMLVQNEKINWVLGNIKYGCFGNWLEGNVDWVIFCECYWGMLLFFWQFESGQLCVIGSVVEFFELVGCDLSDFDFYWFYIDDIIFMFDGEEYCCVFEVFDVWFDLGLMFYVQWGLLLNEQGEVVCGVE